MSTIKINLTSTFQNFTNKLKTIFVKKTEIGTIASKNQDDYVPTTQDGTNAAINRLSIGTSTPKDEDYCISQYVGGGTTTTTFHRRPLSSLWNWIDGKKINNAANADQLSAARTIWGNSFDGTADVNGDILVSKSDTSSTRVSTNNSNGKVSLLSSTNRGLWDDSKSKWIIATNGTNTWLDDGNVGIGTTSPSEMLEVSGNVKATKFIGKSNDSDKLDGFDSEDFSHKHTFNNINKARVKLMSITRTGRGGVTFSVSGVSNNNIARYNCVYGIYWNSGSNIIPVFHEFVNYLNTNITAIKVSDTQYDLYLTAPSAWGNYDVSIIYAQACDIAYPKTTVDSITGEEIPKSNAYISSPVSVHNTIAATGLVKSDTGFQTTGYVSAQSVNASAANL